MSGHSKWSQIKRQKGANDAKRGAVFTKIAREIGIAARAGGGDPDANYRLRLAIDKARAVNMPADNIKRAIEKATAAATAEQYEEIVYEGYGPGGVAILVETATDNKQPHRRGRARRCSPRPAASSPARAPWPGSSSRAASSPCRATASTPTRSPWWPSTPAPTTWTPTSDPIEVDTDPGDLEARAQGASRRAGVKIESAELTMHAKTTVEIDAHARAPEPAPDRERSRTTTTSSASRPTSRCRTRCWPRPRRDARPAAATVDRPGHRSRAPRVTGYGVVERDGSIGCG